MLKPNGFSWQKINAFWACISAHVRDLAFTWQAYCLLLTTAQLLVTSCFVYKGTGHPEAEETGWTLSFCALKLYSPEPGKLLEWLSADKSLILFFPFMRSCMDCGSL